MSVELVSQEEQELIDDYKKCCFEETQHVLHVATADTAVDVLVNSHYRNMEEYFQAYKELTQRRVEAKRRLEERGIPLPKLY